jgi:hypothetical protein
VPAKGTEKAAPSATYVTCNELSLSLLRGAQVESAVYSHSNTTAQKGNILAQKQQDINAGQYRAMPLFHISQLLTTSAALLVCFISSVAYDSQLHKFAMLELTNPMIAGYDRMFKDKG